MPNEDWSSASEESQTDCSDEDVLESFSFDKSHDNGESLELIKLRKTQDDFASVTINLNQENLDTVLQSTENCPLCIISIVGPRNSGKSLLLNYIRLNLEALEHGDKNYDVTNIKSRLTEFNLETNSGPETQGIFIWSRAFLIKTGTRDIAVVLLDCGLEKLTTPGEKSSIFGLSLLSSSIIIYNLKKTILSADFNPLITFLGYGLACRDIDRQCWDEPPFQKLSFLVRDWDKPNAQDYGQEGGKSLLKAKLEDLRAELSIVTEETLNKCFHQVDCFLLPKMEKEHPPFSTCTMEINPEFSLQILNYINSILKKENLLVLKILGTPVTASDYISYLQKYCEVFNSFATKGQILTKEEILKVRCETFHENLVSKSLASYNQIMKRKLKYSKYLPEFDLQTTHKKGIESALSVFKISRKLAEFTTKYEKLLCDQLEAEFEAVKLSNRDLRKTYISECIQAAEKAFEKELLQQFSFDNQRLTVNEDDVMYSISQITRQKIVDNFSNTFSKEEDLSSLVSSLEKVLISTWQSYLERNNQNKKEADRILFEISEKTINEHKAIIHSLVTDLPSIDTHLLSKLLVMEQKRSLAKFDEADKPDAPRCTQRHREYIQRELDKIFQTINEKKETELAYMVQEAEKLLQMHVEEYKDIIKKQIHEVSSAETLETVHDKTVLEIMKKFPENASQHQIINTRLKHQLELVFNEELFTKNSLENKMTKAVSNALQLYMKVMKDVKGSEEFLEQEKLMEAHESCLKTVLSNYEESQEHHHSPVAELYQEKLKLAIEKEFAKIIADNEHTVKLLRIEANSWIKEFLKRYQQAMFDPVMILDHEEEIKRKNEEIKFDTVELYKEKWCLIYKSINFQDEFIKKLEKEIDEAFTEILELFNFKRSIEISILSDAKRMVRDYYHEEMEKHSSNQQFVLPKVLETLHTRACQSAISRYTSKYPMNNTEALQQALQKSYTKYRDVNAMLSNSNDEPAIGIDLGTTYCCVAVFFNGKTIIVRSSVGCNTTPSYVAFNPDGTYIIGQPAKDNAFRNLENTVYDAKRIIGRSINDRELKNDIKYWPFNVVDGDEGAAIEIFGKQYPPEQIVALLLKQLVSQAEELIGKAVRKAVITVPAYFTDAQRAATLDAGEMAGIEVLQILDEPTAAALAYKMERFYEDARKVLIFDLGGGTLDISILEVDGNKIRVLNKDGDTHLGGEDFDKAMMEYCCNEFRKQHGVDPFQGIDSTQKQERDAVKQRLRRLQTYCERGKIDLSVTQTTVILIDAFFSCIDMEMTITRQTFEELNAIHFKNALDIVERSLRQINWSKAEIDDIVLVGGSTRIPKVQQMLREYFEGKALNYSIHPDEAVAYGAAVQAALLNGVNTIKELSFGCIEDVTPMSIGVEAIIDGVAGAFSPIICKNSAIPTIHKEVYRTYKDNQESAVVKIYQGEAPMAKDNKLLGEFALSGIPNAPAGKECIEINMEIDAMGVLNVKAVVKSTRRQECLTVNEKKPGRMSQTTKQRLLHELQST